MPVNKSTKPQVLLLLGVLFLGLIAPVLLNMPVSAQAASGAWIDAANIKVGDDTYTDNKLGDSRDYYLGGTEGCFSEIDTFTSGNTKGRFTTRTKDTVNDKCVDNNPRPITIDLSEADKSDDYFRWVDAGKLESVFSKQSAKIDELSIQAGASGYYMPGIYESINGSTTEFALTGAGDCRSTLTVTASGSAKYTYRKKSGSQCFVSLKSTTVGLGSTDNRNVPAGQGTPTGTAGQFMGDVTDTGTSCENTGWEMSWILCPLLRQADNVTEYLDRTINNLLTVPNYYFENPRLENTWAKLRNIAYIILVPILLVMVISTALGFDFVSAYTVKKALPRLIAATIFIALSYEITKFMIVVTNNIGSGILGIMGGGDPVTLSSLFKAEGGNDIGAIFSGAIITGGAFAIGSLGIVASFALVTVVGLLIGFVALSLRQLLLIALMILAPLAILAWIFPGNDKLWKLWWNAFSKLLLLFPLIMIIIGGGRIFASIIDTAADNGGEDGDKFLITTMLKLVAYVAPYFFIPSAFKFAGGLFATLSGMANDRSRGLFDRQKKYRQAQMSQNWERNGQRRLINARSNMAGKLQSSASGGNRISAFAKRGLASTIGGYNIEAAMSAKNASVGKEINDQIATGRDEDIRGLTATYAFDLARRNKAEALRQQVYRENPDGTRQYKSLGGYWVDEANVLAGRQRWGNDTFAKQAALSYEMRKAATEQELQHLAGNYNNQAQSWGMNEREASGAWIGAAFENQNQHIEFKKTNWKTGKIDSPQKRNEFINEIYEKKGSYQLAQMSSNTIEQLKVAYEDAAAAGDVDQVQKIQGIAETFMHEYGSAGVGAVVDDMPVTGAPAGAKRQANTPGAAHVAERVRELAVLTGAYGRAPSGQYTAINHPTNSPNQREQK